MRRLITVSCSGDTPNRMPTRSSTSRSSSISLSILRAGPRQAGTVAHVAVAEHAGAVHRESSPGSAQAELVADRVGVADGPVFDDPTVAYADHVHAQDLVASAGGRVRAPAGVAVDRRVARRHVLFDRHRDVVAAVVAERLPVEAPGIDAELVAGGAAPVIDDVRVDERESLIHPAGEDLVGVDGDD